MRIPVSCSATKEQLHALIDDDLEPQTLAVIQSHRWRYSRVGHYRSPRVCTNAPDLDAPLLLLHRFVVGCLDLTLRVIHRNDDFLDCRRENLVVMTPKQFASDRSRWPRRDVRREPHTRLPERPRIVYPPPPPPPVYVDVTFCMDEEAIALLRTIARQRRCSPSKCLEELLHEAAK